MYIIKNIIFLLALLSLIFSADWQQKADYKINLELNPKTDIMTGNLELIYKNNSSDILNEIYFHLYPYAFNKDSQFMHDSDRWGWGVDEQFANKYEKSFLKMSNIIIKGKEHTYTRNGTIAKIVLEEPIKPGETRIITMDFIEKIGVPYGRWGKLKGNYHLVHWHPKVSVYDHNGWNNDEHSVIGEFYGEFGDFEVSITLPSDMPFVASGRRVSEITNQDKITAIYKIDNVHNFAICADRKYKILKDEHKGITLEIAYFTREKFAVKALKYAKTSIDFFERCYGPYAYPTYVIAETEIYAGVMEYPALSIIDRRNFHVNPLMDHALEGSVVHEFGHNYWYGMVANHETRQAWLDEGLNTYSVMRYFEEKHGEDDNGLNWPKKFKWLPNVSYRDMMDWTMYDQFKWGHEYAMSNRMHDYRTKGGYAASDAVNYTKGARVFDLLEEEIGTETLDKILAHYYKNNQFKHVTPEDILASANAVTGKDYSDFFNYWIYSEKTDFKKLLYLADVKHNKVRLTLVDIPKGNELLLNILPYAFTDSGYLKYGLMFLGGKRYFMAGGPFFMLRASMLNDNKNTEIYEGNTHLPLYFLTGIPLLDYAYLNANGYHTSDDNYYYSANLQTSFGKYFFMPTRLWWYNGININSWDGTTSESVFSKVIIETKSPSVYFSKKFLTGLYPSYTYEFGKAGKHDFTKMMYEVNKDTRIFFKTHLNLRMAYGEIYGGTNSANAFSMYRAAGFASLDQRVRRKTVGEADLKFPIRAHAGWVIWPGWIELESMFGTLEYETFAAVMGIGAYESLSAGLNINMILFSPPLEIWPSINLRYTFWTEGGGDNTIWLSGGSEF